MKEDHSALRTLLKLCSAGCTLHVCKQADAAIACPTISSTRRMDRCIPQLLFLSSQKRQAPFTRTECRCLLLLVVSSFCAAFTTSTNDPHKNIGRVQQEQQFDVLPGNGTSSDRTGRADRADRDEAQVVRGSQSLPFTDTISFFALGDFGGGPGSLHGGENNVGIEGKPTHSPMVRS